MYVCVCAHALIF